MDYLAPPRALPNISVESTFICPNKCGRKYRYLRGLRRHLSYECGKDKQFQCKICFKTFVHKDKLRRHETTIHTPGDEKQFKCHLCPKEFYRSDQLKEHLRALHPEILFFQNLHQNISLAQSSTPTAPTSASLTPHPSVPVLHANAPFTDLSVSLSSPTVPPQLMKLEESVKNELDYEPHQQNFY